MTTQDACEYDNSIYGISSKLSRTLCATPKFLRSRIQQSFSSLTKQFGQTDAASTQPAKLLDTFSGLESPAQNLKRLFDREAVGKKLSKVISFEEIKEEAARGALEGVISETLAVLMCEDAGLDVPTDASRMMVHGIGSNFADLVKLTGVYFKKSVERTLFSAMITQDSGSNPMKLLSQDFKPDWNRNLIKQPATDLELKMTLGAIRKLALPLFIRSVAHTVPTMAVHFSSDEVQMLAHNFPNFF